MPFRGKNEEISKGRKTVIELLDDRLDYAIKYTYSTKRVGEEDEEIPIDLEIEEVGTIVRDKIVSITHFIENEIQEDGVYHVHMISIHHGSDASLNISCEDEATKTESYKELYNWLYNIVE